MRRLTLLEGAIEVDPEATHRYEKSIRQIEGRVLASVRIVSHFPVRAVEERNKLSGFAILDKGGP